MCDSSCVNCILTLRFQVRYKAAHLIIYHFYLQFCSEDWSEDMEKELCLLWDMTVEADVAELLMQRDFLDLTSRIIHDTTIPRLIVSFDCSVQYDNSDFVVQLLQLAFWPAQMC